MKNYKVLIAAVLAAAFFQAAGCGTETAVKSGNWLDENRSEIMAYAYTKAQIQEVIDASWQEYGYSSKPDKFIAISFDDGPCDSSASGGTAALLKKLEELKVRATFFVIGQNVQNNKAAAQAIFDAGHELGNHSNGYGSLGTAKKETITASLDSASKTIMEITGKYPLFFRAPNLDHGSSLSKVCAERGMPLIDGSAHNDWPGSTQAIKSSVLNGARDGGIIILHENNTSHGNTMAALDDIVRGLREKGFWIVTVGELAAVKEKSLKAGARYSAMN